MLFVTLNTYQVSRKKGAICTWGVFVVCSHCPKLISIKIHKICVEVLRSLSVQTPWTDRLLGDVHVTARHLVPLGLYGSRPVQMHNYEVTTRIHTTHHNIPQHTECIRNITFKDPNVLNTTVWPNHKQNPLAMFITELLNFFLRNILV